LIGVDIPRPERDPCSCDREAQLFFIPKEGPDFCVPFALAFGTDALCPLLSPCILLLIFPLHDELYPVLPISLWLGRPRMNLEPESRRRLDPHLEPVDFTLGDMVCDAGGLLKHAYFPQGSVLSLLTVLENGAAIETANIGREGAFGLFAARCSRVSFNRCIVQLEGHTVRCPIQLLQYEFRNSEHVRDLFVSYSETLLSQVQQTVACNSMHTTEERMCRWLLMMHDRAGGVALPYTHEFLSHILGANRKKRATMRRPGSN
jgi:CRP-like cAMP-binding protein